MVPILLRGVPDVHSGGISPYFRLKNAKKMFFSYFLSLISNREQLY